MSHQFDDDRNILFNAKALAKSLGFVGNMQEDFTEEEKQVILRFLASRSKWTAATILGIGAMMEDGPEEWARKNTKYWRWTEATINWLTASLYPGKKKRNASNKTGS